MNHGNGVYLQQFTHGQVIVSDDAFDLMELGQMGGVDALVSENAVDGEVSRCWWPTIRPFDTCQFMEHVGAHGRRMRPKHQT